MDLNGRLRGLAEEQRIGSGLECLECRSTQFVMGRDRGHFEVVAEEDPAKSEFLAEQRAEDPWRERCRQQWIESGIEDMGGHQRGNAGLHRGTEGDDLALQEEIVRSLDPRQGEMRVGIRISVPGEMFAAREDTAGTESARYRAAEGGH